MVAETLNQSVPGITYFVRLDLSDPLRVRLKCVPEALNDTDTHVVTLEHEIVFAIFIKLFQVFREYLLLARCTRKPTATDEPLLLLQIRYEVLDRVQFPHQDMKRSVFQDMHEPPRSVELPNGKRLYVKIAVNVMCRANHVRNDHQTSASAQFLATTKRGIVRHNDPMKSGSVHCWQRNWKRLSTCAV